MNYYFIVDLDNVLDGVLRLVLNVRVLLERLLVFLLDLVQDVVAQFPALNYVLLFNALLKVI